jgi:hypothetical protein
MVWLSRLMSCVADVFVASFAPLPIYAVYLLLGKNPFGWALLIAVGYMWLVPVACGEIFVVPVVALMPAARRPRATIAAMWGVGIAWTSSITLLGLGTYRPWVWLLVVALAGGVSGWAYAALARRRPV